MPIKKLIKEVQAFVANVKELVNKDSAAVKVSPNFNFIQNDPAANSSLIKNMPPMQHWGTTCLMAALLQGKLVM